LIKINRSFVLKLRSSQIRPTPTPPVHLLLIVVVVAAAVVVEAVLGQKNK
jgi:hypothetical protein